MAEAGYSTPAVNLAAKLSEVAPNDCGESRESMSPQLSHVISKAEPTLAPVSASRVASGISASGALGGGKTPLVKQKDLFFGIEFILLKGLDPGEDDSLLRCQLPGRLDQGFGQLCEKAANILDIDGEWVSTQEAYFDSQRRKMWVWVRMPFYHPRLKGYDIEYLPVESDAQWKEATEGREWDLVTWVQRTSVFLAAKMATGDKELEPQGAHGFWELASNKDYFPLFTHTMLQCIIRGLHSQWGETVTYAAATCWALARSEVLRGDLVHLEAVEALLEAACWAFHIPYDMQAHLASLAPPKPKKTKSSKKEQPYVYEIGAPPPPPRQEPPPEPEPPPDPVAAARRKPCALAPEQIKVLQENTLGALAVLACDVRCRTRLFKIHPGLDPVVRIAQLCLQGGTVTLPEVQSGTSAYTAVYILSTIIIRDADGRQSFADAASLAPSLPDLMGTRDERVMIAAAFAMCQYAREPWTIRVLAQSKHSLPVLHASVTIGLWSAQCMAPSPPVKPSLMNTKKATLEAAALACWGAVCAATQHGDEHVCAEDMSLFAQMIQSVVLLGAMGKDALFLLMGSACALAAEGAGVHAALLVRTQGIVAIQAALDSLPANDWTHRELLIGCHAAAALGLVAQHEAGGEEGAWAPAEPCMEGPHRTYMNQRNVVWTLLNATPPAKGFRNQAMEELVASAVMLLTAQYLHTSRAQYQREVEALVHMLRHVCQAEVHLGAHEGGGGGEARHPEEQSRVLQFLLSAAWGVLRQQTPRRAFVDADGVAALLDAVRALYPRLLPPRHPTDPTVVSGMFALACLWLCLAELKDSWVHAVREVSAPLFVLEEHAIWTVAAPRASSGEVPDLHPTAELAVRRVVEMMSLPGNEPSKCCLHELAVRAAWQLCQETPLFQFAFIKVGVLGALCDLTKPGTPECIQVPAAALLEELVGVAEDPDLAKRLQKVYVDFLRREDWNVQAHAARGMARITAASPATRRHTGELGGVQALLHRLSLKNLALIHSLNGEASAEHLGTATNASAAPHQPEVLDLNTPLAERGGGGGASPLPLAAETSGLDVTADPGSSGRGVATLAPDSRLLRESSAASLGASGSRVPAEPAPAPSPRLRGAASPDRMRESLMMAVMEGEWRAAGALGLCPWTHPTQPEELQELLLQALFNLSLEPQNQVCIVREGVYTLLRIRFRDAATEAAKHFAACTLENCSSHGLNVTALYAAELKCKAAISERVEQEDNDPAYDDEPQEEVSEDELKARFLQWSANLPWEEMTVGSTFDRELSNASTVLQQKERRMQKLFFAAHRSDLGQLLAGIDLKTMGKDWKELLDTQVQHQIKVMKDVNHTRGEFRNLNAVASLVAKNQETKARHLEQRERRRGTMDQEAEACKQLLRGSVQARRRPGPPSTSVDGLQQDPVHPARWTGPSPHHPRSCSGGWEEARTSQGEVETNASVWWTLEEGPDHHLQASQVSSLPALASSPSFFRCTTASSRDRWSPSRKVPPSPARSPSHRGPAPRYTEGSELGRPAGSSSALFRPITSPDWGLRSSKSAPGHGPESGPSQTRKEGGGGALRDERARTSHATAGGLAQSFSPMYRNDGPAPISRHSLRGLSRGSWDNFVKPPLPQEGQGGSHQYHQQHQQLPPATAPGGARNATAVSQGGGKGARRRRAPTPPGTAMPRLQHTLQEPVSTFWKEGFSESLNAKALKAGNGRWDAQVKEFVHVAALPPAKQETRPRSVSDTVSGTVSSSSSSIPLVLATRPDTASMLVNNSKAQIQTTGRERTRHQNRKQSLKLLLDVREEEQPSAATGVSLTEAKLAHPRLVGGSNQHKQQQSPEQSRQSQHGHNNSATKALAKKSLEEQAPPDLVGSEHEAVSLEANPPDEMEMKSRAGMLGGKLFVKPEAEAIRDLEMEMNSNTRKKPAVRPRMREHMAGRVKLVTSERGDAEAGSKIPPDKGYAHKKKMKDLKKQLPAHVKLQMRQMARREQEQEELQREREEEEEKAPELATAAVVPPLKSYPAGSVMVQHKQRLGTPLVVAMSEAPPPQSALECEPSDAQEEAPMPMPILTVPMQVTMEPGGKRNTVAFREPWQSGGAASRLTVFEHVKDCKVCEGLYKHVPLPNGKLAHVFDQGAALAEAAAPPPEPCPPLPISLFNMLAANLPPTHHFLHYIKPRGNEPPSMWRPIPDIGPPPSRHTLKVVDPNNMTDGWGDLLLEKMIAYVHVEPNAEDDMEFIDMEVEQEETRDARSDKAREDAEEEPDKEHEVDDELNITIAQEKEARPKSPVKTTRFSEPSAGSPSSTPPAGGKRQLSPAPAPPANQSPLQPGTEAAGTEAAGAQPQEAVPKFRVYDFPAKSMAEAKALLTGPPSRAPSLATPPNKSTRSSSVATQLHLTVPDDDEQEVETDEELKALKKAGQWRLEGSSFWPRAVSSDSQSLWDLHVAYHKAFQADWEYLKKFPRFKKFVLDELTVARKRSVCMMVLGGVFEDDPEKPSKRGPPLNKFETRGLFTHKAPAKPVQFTKMPVMLAEAGMTVEEPAKGGARVKTPQAAKRPDTAEEAEEKPEDTKLYMIKDSYAPLSPRNQSEDFFVPSLLRASVSKGPDNKFSKEFLERVIQESLGEKTAGNAKVELKASFGESTEIEIDKKELASVYRTIKIALYVHYRTIVRLFDYYSSFGKGEATVMQSVGFKKFLQDMQIPSEESRGCKEEDCLPLMRACNLGAPMRERMRLGGKLEDSQLALSRPDFMEVVTRLACFKCMRDYDTDDFSLAVDLFFKYTIRERVMGAGAALCLDRNVFRGFAKAPNRCPLGDLPYARFYTRGMDALFQKHYSVLEAVYRRCKMKDSFEPYRNELMELPQFLMFLEENHLMGKYLTLQAATLCFVRARMQVVNMVDDYVRWKSLEFTDFFEALVRIADHMCLPTRTELTAKDLNATQFILALEDPESEHHYSKRTKKNTSEIFVEEVDVLLEHIVRVAGGNMHEHVIPPAPRIIDLQLRQRKLNAMKATNMLQALVRFNRDNKEPPPPPPPPPEKKPKKKKET